MPTYDIEIKKVPAMRVASLWAKGLPFNVTVPKAYEELAAWMAEKKIPFPAGSPMGLALYYDDPGTAAPEEVRFKVLKRLSALTLQSTTFEELELIQHLDNRLERLFVLEEEDHAISRRKPH